MTPAAGQPGHGLTANLRRQPVRLVEGRAGGGYTGAFEVICRDCGDHPYLDYSQVPLRLQRLGGRTRWTRALRPTGTTSGWSPDGAGQCRRADAKYRSEGRPGHPVVREAPACCMRKTARPLSCRAGEASGPLSVPGPLYRVRACLWPRPGSAARRRRCPWPVNERGHRGLCGGVDVLDDLLAQQAAACWACALTQFSIEPSRVFAFSRSSRTSSTVLPKWSRNQASTWPMTLSGAAGVPMVVFPFRVRFRRLLWRLPGSAGAG